MSYPERRPSNDVMTCHSCSCLWWAPVKLDPSTVSNGLGRKSLVKLYISVKNGFSILDLMVCVGIVPSQVCFGPQMTVLFGEVIEPLGGEAVGEELEGFQPHITFCSFSLCFLHLDKRKSLHQLPVSLFTLPCHALPTIIDCNFVLIMIPLGVNLIP